MRKRVIGRGAREVSAAEPGWLDLERLAQVEVTSEDVDHPIESALIPGTGSGWRASQPGDKGKKEAKKPKKNKQKIEQKVKPSNK